MSVERRVPHNPLTRQIQIITCESYVIRTPHLHEEGRVKSALARLETLRGRTPELAEQVSIINSMELDAFKDHFDKVFPKDHARTKPRA